MDYKAIAADLLKSSYSFVPQWLPGGHRLGFEWCCGSIYGGHGNSFRVNLKTGKWAEFAGDLRGGDLLSLYAAIHKVRNSEAARLLGYDKRNVVECDAPSW